MRPSRAWCWWAARLQAGWCSGHYCAGRHRSRSSRWQAAPAPGGIGRAGADAAAASEVIANVAHDIRSPLLTVHSYLQLLAEDAFGPLPEDAPAPPRIARGGTGAVAGGGDSERAGPARCQAPAGARRAPRTTVGLRMVVQDVIGSLEVEFAAVQAEMEVQDLPPVLGSDSALCRVFANLLQNAVK